MGVRGLQTYIRYRKENLLSDFRLQDTKLIIDGSNLVYILYDHFQVPYQCGGDYNHFAEKCKDFFHDLAKCNVTPIVVFDGAYERTDKKWQTVIERLNKQFSKVKSGDYDVLPLLSKETFRQVLVDLDLAHASCLFEADREIAVLANKLKCPVLSNDSDFYVFNLECGYIPTASIFENLRTDLRGKLYKPVRIYSCKSLLKEVFETEEEDEYILPVFATLVGNDYFDSSKIILTHPYNSTDKIDCRSPDKQVIVDWLRRSGFENGLKAFEYVCGQIPGDMKSKFETSVNSYKDIKDFEFFDLEMFLDTESESEPSESLSADNIETCSTIYQRESNAIRNGSRERTDDPYKSLEDYNGKVLPSWFIHGLIKCDMNCSFLLNTSINHRVTFKTQVEMLEKPSSYACSKGIRRVMYGIILGQASRSKDGKTRKTIQEYDRRERARSNVNPIFKLPGFSKLPELESIPGLPESDRKALLYATFGEMTFDKGMDTFVEDMDDTSKVLILMLSLWKENSNAKECHLNVLIIGIMALQICKLTRPNRCKDILNASEDMRRDQLDGFREYVHQHFKRTGHTSGMDLDLAHKLAQFQTCYLHITYLNQLLLNPVYIPGPNMILEGTFVNNIWYILAVHNAEYILRGKQSALFALFLRWKNVIEKLCKKCVRPKCPVACTKIERKLNPTNRFRKVRQRINNAS